MDMVLWHLYQISRWEASLGTTLNTQNLWEYLNCCISGKTGVFPWYCLCSSISGNFYLLDLLSWNTGWWYVSYRLETKSIQDTDSPNSVNWRQSTDRPDLVGWYRGCQRVNVHYLDLVELIPILVSYNPCLRETKRKKVLLDMLGNMPALNEDVTADYVGSRSWV